MSVTQVFVDSHGTSCVMLIAAEEALSHWILVSFALLHVALVRWYVACLIMFASVRIAVISPGHHPQQGNVLLTLRAVQCWFSSMGNASGWPSCGCSRRKEDPPQGEIQGISVLLLHCPGPFAKKTSWGRESAAAKSEPEPTAVVRLYPPHWLWQTQEGLNDLECLIAKWTYRLAIKVWLQNPFLPLRIRHAWNITSGQIDPTTLLDTRMLEAASKSGPDLTLSCCIVKVLHQFQQSTIAYWQRPGVKKSRVSRSLRSLQTRTLRYSWYSYSFLHLLFWICLMLSQFFSRAWRPAESCAFQGGKAAERVPLPSGIFRRSFFEHCIERWVIRYACVC